MGGNFNIKKEAKRPQTQAGSATIADLKDAIEALASVRKKPHELGEGIIAEALALAYEWKDSKNQRPLFDESSHKTSLLLAALVVALSQDHKLIELIRRHFPNELNKLVDQSFKADELSEASVLASAEPLTSKQKHDRKRSKQHRGYGGNSIEYQFGGGLETGIVKAGQVPSGSFYEFVVFSGQDCLDDVFAGCSVNMQGLEDLFDMDRHRLSKLLQGDPKGDYRDVVKIMDALLKEKSREKRRSSKRGRPPPEPWLNGFSLRRRVLKRIESRIKSVTSGERQIDPDNARNWKKEIANAFLGLVRRHLKSLQDLVRVRK